MPNILNPARGSDIQALIGAGQRFLMPGGGTIQPGQIKATIPASVVPRGKSGDFLTRPAALECLVPPNGVTVDQVTNKAKLTGVYQSGAQIQIDFNNQERCNILAPVDPIFLWCGGPPVFAADLSAPGGLKRGYGTCLPFAANGTDESPWYKLDIPWLGDGTYRWLVRQRGTQPAGASSQGPEPVFRAKIGLVAGVTNVIQAYSSGPWALTGTTRQRIRRLTNGVIVDLNTTSVVPIQTFGQWFWHKTEIIGNTIKQVQWIEGTAEPGAYLYSVIDASFPAAADTFNGIGFRRGAGNNHFMDIARFEYLAA